MNETALKNQVFKGFNGKESLYDLSIPETSINEAILFIHGYMGYKDWGAWHLVEQYFIQNNYPFCKFNLSHNGGTIENPIDFPDLDSFSINSYYREIRDIELIVQHLLDQHNIKVKHIIGHSRGGGLALLSSKISGLQSTTTWAAIADIEERFPKGEAMVQWKNDGVYYRKNGRTHQDMPHSYSQYEEYLQHQSALNILSACKQSQIPTMVIQGENDSSVDMSNAQRLATWLNIQPVIIKDAQHTFATKQPWIEKSLPSQLEEVCIHTLKHIQANNEQPR